MPVLVTGHSKMAYLFISLLRFEFAVACVNALALVGFGCEPIALLHADPPQAVQVFPRFLP